MVRYLRLLSLIIRSESTNLIYTCHAELQNSWKYVNSLFTALVFIPNSYLPFFHLSIVHFIEHLLWTGIVTDTMATLFNKRNEIPGICIWKAGRGGDRKKTINYKQDNHWRNELSNSNCKDKCNREWLGAVEGLEKTSELELKWVWERRSSIF